MDMQYSRSNPSPRYRELVAHYQDMHVNGERHLGLPAAKTFPGQRLVAEAPMIKMVMEKFRPRTVLDYGSGKGFQYQVPFTAPDGAKYERITDYWGVDSIHCYDPAYEPFTKLPEGRFDAVISTDVLEHCPETDLHWIIAEMFSYAKMFVYGAIASYPAIKHLPNGENAHCTVKPTEWWRDLIEPIARDHRSLHYIFLVAFKVAGPDGTETAKFESIQG